MEILQQLFPGKITNCQMNIHYALNILKINEIWKFYSNYFPVKSLIVR